MSEQTLDDLFDLPTTTYEKKESPVFKLDYKLEQSLRFRSGRLPGKMKVVRRHWVDGVGYVECGQTVGKITKDRGTDKERTEITLWTKDREGNATCEFCLERSNLRKSLKAKAAKEGRSELNKEESAKCRKLHNRVIEAFSPVEGEVIQDGEVVVEKKIGVAKFNVMDLFLSSQNQAWKQFQAIEKALKAKKKTFTDYWFTMDSKGQIQRDDEVTKEEKKTVIDYDLSFLDEQTKSYKDGLALYLKRKSESNNVEPLDEEENQEPNEEESVVDLDDEIAF